MEFPPVPQLHDEGTLDDEGVPDPSQGGPEEHWYFFRAMLVITLRSFGWPAKLYEQIVIRCGERSQLAGVVRALEAMARRILLIAASEDRRPLEPLTELRNTRGPAKGVTAMGPERQKFMGLPPKTFPIRFALAPPPKWQGETFASRKKGRMPWHGKPNPPSNWASAFALAARLEAIIRVYKNPMPYVMRLRQKLAQSQGKDAHALVARINHMPRFLMPHIEAAVAELDDDSLKASLRIFRPSG